MHLPLVIDWDKIGTILWLIDASFTVYKGIHSYTGAVMILGKGSLLSLSAKQKINTKSSTEAEIVAVDDAMDFIEWVQFFVKDQIRDINPKSPVKLIGNKTTIQQDNISTIQLKNNGKRDLVPNKQDTLTFTTST